MLRSVRDAAWAAGFVRDFAAGERPTLFKRLGGTPTVTSHTAADEGGGAIRYDVYEVAANRRTPRPALIVTHGFTHLGSHDPRLQALCRRLARLGWIVVAPEFPEMRTYRLGLNDTDRLDTIVHAVAATEGVDGSRVGVMAFSFGAAPLLIGLSRRALRERVAFALVFGGYFDLRRTLRYVLTGSFDCAGYRGCVPLPTRNDDRWKFLRGNVHLVPPSDRRDAYVTAIESRIADAASIVDGRRFSAEERALWTLMENRAPDRFDAVYEAAAPLVDGWVRAMSPARVAGAITTPLVIVHSVTDPKTHFSESVAMSGGLPNAPTPHLAIVNTFSHVDLDLGWRSLRTLRSDILPGARQIWQVGLRLVRESRGAPHWTT